MSVCAFVCVHFAVVPHSPDILQWMALMNNNPTRGARVVFLQILHKAASADWRRTAEMYGYSSACAHTHTEHLSFKVFICREKNLPHIFRFPCLIHEKQTVFLGFLTLEFAFVDLCAALLYLLCTFIFFLSSCTSTNDLKVQTHLANLIFWSTITPCIS